MSFKPRISPKLDYYETGGGGTGGADGINRIAAGTQSAGLTATVVFSNSNNVSFGMSNNSVVTGSASFNQTEQTQNLHNLTLSGNTAGVMAQVSSGTLTLAGGNNITLSQNGNAVTISAGAGGGGIALANSQTTYTSGTANILEGGGAITIQSTTGQKFQFSVPATSSIVGAGNVSISTNGSTVTISASTQTNQTLGLYASSNTTGQSSSSTFDARSVTFRGVGVASVGMSGGEVIISVPSGGGAGDGVNILAAGTQTANTTGTVLFSNSNGVSFGMSNSSIITASHNGITSQTVQTQNMVSVNGSTGNISLATGSSLSSSSNGSTITFGLASNITTALQSAGAYLTTAMASNRGSDFVQATAVFNGTNASGTIASGAISVSVANASNSSLTMQAGASTLSSVSRIAFADSNGISFGASTSNNGSITITATVKTDYQSSNANYLTSQSNQNITAGNGGFAFQTLSFSNANGISFSTSAGSAIVASHNGLTQQSTQPVALSGSNGSFNFSTATFGNLNGMSFYTSNGSMVGSYTVPTQTNQTIGIYGSSQTTGQSSSSTYDARSITFRGAGIVSVGNSGGEVIISATGGGGVTPVASASNGSFSFTTLNFSNANNVTFGTSAGSIITASVAAPGAAAENNWINLLGANTAGNTTASGSTIGWSGINLTLSGTNGSAVNISAPATSSLSATGQVSISTNGSTISIGVPNQVTLSGFHPYGDLEMVTMATSQGTLSIEPMVVPNVQFDRVLFPINNTNSSNSSGSHSLSFRVGIYTQNGSTLSLLASASQSTAVTHSGTAGSYSLMSGMRLFSIGMTTTLTEGMYWIAFNSNTTSGGANGSYSLMGLSQIASNFLGHFGSSHNTTYQFTLGQGIYTASTTAMPNSIGFSQIRGSDSVAFRSPYIGFASSTI